MGTLLYELLFVWCKAIQGGCGVPFGMQRGGKFKGCVG